MRVDELLDATLLNLFCDTVERCSNHCLSKKEKQEKKEIIRALSSESSSSDTDSEPVSIYKFNNYN